MLEKAKMLQIKFQVESNQSQPENLDATTIDIETNDTGRQNE